MSKNETGEFELVLGNKQLLSVFFIVVILLGVFFTMGYIVGRNSSPPPIETANRRGATPATEPRSPLIVDSPAAPPPSQIPAATETKPAVEEPKPSTSTPAPAATTPEPAPKEAAKEKEKEKKQPEPAKPTPAAAAPAPAAIGSLQKGLHYLQVQALPTEQAALVADVMRKKGFATVTEAVPNRPALTRILVGPVDPAAAPDMKTKLEDAGFKGKQAILRKVQ
jgi:outer membrane biosynthesis protein TonB